MFIVSGIKRDNGHHNLVNLDSVTSMGVSSIPDYIKYVKFKKYAGDRSLILYYCGERIRDQEVIFTGTLEQCIVEQEAIEEALITKKSVHYITHAEENDVDPS